MAYLGGSAIVLSNLSVGALAFATFGIINSSITTSLYESHAYTTTNKINNKFNGYGFRFGALYEPKDNLFLGAYIEKHSKLEFEEEITYGADLISDSTFTQNNEIFLPGSFGFGASYLLGKFRFGGDYKIYNLKDMDFNKGPNTEYRNMQVISIAVSRLGNTSINAQYLDKITYNFGLGYKELYYKINGVDINEIYGSFGLNLPLTESAIIDASFTLGRRGSSDDKLVQELFGRLTIDISIGETWFKPFKREY
jgi:long-subunit fatty acid transport protein